jgi:hypothetical protein
VYVSFALVEGVVLEKRINCESSLPAHLLL